MPDQALARRATSPSAGALLKQWRDVRGKSQLTLAFDTGISQRHVSFVETGRSVPSRQMIVDLSDALGVPLRERNAIFVAAGYAPVYRQDPLDGLEMKSIDRAVKRILKQQEPFPALVMDRHWNVIDTNDAAPRFFGRFVDLAGRPKPRNLLHLMFDPAGMRPHLARWEETTRSLLARVEREALGGMIDDATQTLLNELSAYPDVPQDRRAKPTEDALPMIPLGFKADGKVLNFFSMITTVGTPQTVTAQELRLESMFPDDEETERAYLDFVGLE